MSEFDPVEDAQRLCREISKHGTSSDAEGVLVDYIDALTKALRDTRTFVNKVADTDGDRYLRGSAEVLAHTIRHLLDD
jgi:hypothetical protein